MTAHKCVFKMCVGEKSDVACGKLQGCEWTAQLKPSCNADRCPWDRALLCNADPDCMWNELIKDPSDGVSGQCVRNYCPFLAMTECPKDPNCVSTTTKQCVKGGCAKILTEPLCVQETNTQCAWVNTNVVAADGTNTIAQICQEKGLEDIDVRGAAMLDGRTDARCPDTTVSRSYVGLGVGLGILAAILFAAFAWLWYRQKDQQPTHGFSGPDGADEGDLESQMLPSDSPQTPMVQQPANPPVSADNGVLGDDNDL